MLIILVRFFKQNRYSLRGNYYFCVTNFYKTYIMKQYSTTLITITVVCVVVALFSCGRPTSKLGQVADVVEQGSTSSTPGPSERVFVPALAPAMMSEQEKMAFINEHYWDKFDFSDTLFIAEIDTARMVTAMAVYAQGYVPDSLIRESMSRLMAKASTSKRMFEYFLMLTEEVLHDPNSPMRDDERYIPVLEAAIASPLLDEYEKMPLVYDLQIALQNRIGEVANDFRYTLADGRRREMHNIEAEYLIIFISNPGCAMCGEVREQLLSSPQLNELTERGKLKVLVIYPDEDLEAWREHLGDYPQSWINAYDDVRSITKERLYDLRAIPALYLLDSQKRVMAKDCTDVAYIESLVMQAEQR